MSNTISVIDAAGNQLRELEVEESWLERERGQQAVHECVITYLANQRAGSAATKTRSEVSGGGAKPWRQKGTGRARAGSNRSPIWKGGGVSFGPQPRSYRRKLNKKVRRLALRRAFTEALDAGKLLVIDSLSVEQPRTALFSKLIKGSGAEAKRLLVVAASSDANVVQAGRNIDNITITSADRVNVYELVRNHKLLISEGALQELGKRLA